MTYKALGRSIANYAAPVWSTNASESNIGKIQRAQNEALRIITGSHNNGLFIDFYHYYKSTAYAHILLLLCILHFTHLYQHAYIYETLNQRLLIVILYCIIQQYVPAYILIQFDDMSHFQ